MKTLMILLMLAIGCSPSKRIERICRKNPDVCKTRDTTIVRTDTVIVPERTAGDTTIIRDKDTVTIIKNEIKTRIIRLVDTFEVFTICPADTIVIRDTIKVKTGGIEVTPREKELFKRLKNVMLFLLLLSLVLLIIRRK